MLSMKATQICESLLLKGKRYNEAHAILPSENAVTDRLLARREELKEAYRELHDKLHAQPRALQVFLEAVLTTAAFWNPEMMMQARAARADLESVNRQIADKAAELAQLLEHRSALHDASGFSSDTHYHVCAVIEAAASHNDRFERYVQRPLRALRSQFDLKYWPSLAECLRALSADANDASPAATDPLTAAGTMSARPSLADFFKVLLAAIEENDASNFGPLPRGFRPTDKTLASLANCALNLAPEELVDDGYVKRFRQRLRDGAPLATRS